jgi:phosphate transport system substrate-binding protein
VARAALALLAAVVAVACDARVRAADSAPLRVNGSTTVNLVVAEAAEVLRAERGMSILVDTQGGSSGGIAMLGEGRVEVGMSSKPLDPSDRARYPDVDFVVQHVGQDAVALVVSRDVWDGGLRALSRDQMRGIYEGRFTNWKDVGGAEGRIAFFNKEPGRGTWEVFATWLYGSAKDAPPVSFPEVGGNEETRNKVSGTRGALSTLSSSWADGEATFALALEVAGVAIEPTPANIASGAYPLSRPLFLLTNGAPTGGARALIDFVLSPRGQALVRKHGYLSQGDLAPAAR